MSDRNASALSALAGFLRKHPPTQDAPLSVVVIDRSDYGSYWEVRQGDYTMTFTEPFSDVVADLTVVAAIARRLL